MKKLRTFFTFSVFAACLIFAGNRYASAQETQIAKNTSEKEETTISIEEESSANAAKISNERMLPLKNSSLMTRVGIQTTQTTPLTLNEAIRKALESNNDIEISRSDVKIAETTLSSIEGFYDGVFSFSPTYQRTATTGQSATNDFRVNSDFTKFIKPGGGSIRTFFDNSRTENRFAQAQATQGGTTSGGALFSTSLGITYTQPLLRNFKTDNTRRQIKIQRKRISQSDADFRRQTIEIISQVQLGYWDLVFALRDQQNRLANVNLAKENLRRIEAQISAGSAAPLGRYEVETELANRETELISATQQVETAENRLKQLILRDPTNSEWTSQYVPTDSPVISNDAVNLQLAIKDATENRPELRRLKLESEINKIDIDYFKNQTKPQIDLNNTFSLGGISSTGSGLNDSLTVPLISGDPNLNASAFLLQQIRRFHPSETINVPNVTIAATDPFLIGGFNRSFLNIFRTDAPSYSIGVTISFPFRNKTAKADLAGARFQEERIGAQTRSQEQTVVSEVRNAVQAVESARQRIETATRARVNAEKQLEGERKLFDAGRSTAFLLFQRENTLTNARNSEIRAETDYNKALADLQRATSTTFTANGVEVNSPVKDDQ